MRQDRNRLEGIRPKGRRREVSDNCMHCMKNRRTGGDLLCDNCREAARHNTQRALETCPKCENSGFAGFGTGYDAVCDECGGASRASLPQAIPAGTHELLDRGAYEAMQQQLEGLRQDIVIAQEAKNEEMANVRAQYQDVIITDGKTIQRLEAELSHAKNQTLHALKWSDALKSTLAEERQQHAETRAEAKDAEHRTLEVMKVRDRLEAQLVFLRRECERLTAANGKYCEERDTLARKYQSALKTIDELNKAAIDEQ
jgi:hypothetical protein